MMRFLKVLAVVTCLAVCSSPAKAEAYFGVRLENLVILPLGGVQFGYNFDASDGLSGIGVRGEIATFITSYNRAQINVMYRLIEVPDGNAFYAGGGLGVIWNGTLFIERTYGPVPELHGLIGYEYKFSRQTGLFLEGQVCVGYNFVEKVAFPLFVIGLGFNWHF